MTTQQKSRVYSCFPGCGKSYYKRNFNRSADMDSTDYHWSEDSIVPAFGIKRRVHPQWPGNYVNDIRVYSEIMPIPIFVSTHQEVRDGLVAANVKFTLVYPDVSLKHEYLQRYTKRGDGEVFVEYLGFVWEDLLDSCRTQQGCEHIVLQAGQYLKDVIDD